MMHVKQIVPIVTTTKMRETRAFYLDTLGFELSYDHDHYLGVRAAAAGSPEIGFMRPDQDAPQTFAGAGLTLGVSVESADRECERLRRAGVAILQEPTDQPWGARSFLVRDPNGVLLYLSHPIPAAVEFQGCAR